MLDLYQAFNKSPDSECGGVIIICIIFVKCCCKFWTFLDIWQINCCMVIAKSTSCTAKNTVISPKFLEWKFFGKAQFPHSFDNLSEAVHFQKFTHKEIRWNYGIFCSDRSSICQISMIPGIKLKVQTTISCTSLLNWLIIFSLWNDEKVLRFTWGNL